MTHSLTLGDLLLTDSFPDADHDFKFDVLAEGVGFGVAAGVKEVVTSLLADGDLSRTTRYGNREVSFVVEITGPDLASLAQGEAALRREVGRGNTLTWQPPDDFAVPTVFEVVDSEMAQRFDDLDELSRRRKFTVTLTCSATRSTTLRTIAALAPPTTPTTATITNADTTAGFTAAKHASTTGPIVTTPITPTDQGAYAQATATEYSAIFTVSMTYTTSAVSLSSTPYVIVEASGSGSPSIAMTVNGVRSSYTPVLTRATTGGVTQYVLDSGGGSLTEVHVVSPLFMTGGTATVNIHDISRTDTLPQISARQITRTIEVGGTERTPASIHVETASGTGSLGQCIVHTAPSDGSGYSPPLRRWRVSGQTTTASSTAFSGAFEAIAVPTNAFFAEVPTSAVPEGGYTLVARVHMPTRADGDDRADIYFSVSTEFPDSTTREGYFVDFRRVQFPNANWILVPLAVLTLPTVRTKAGNVQVSISASTANPQVYLDEAWLFREDDDCALSIVDTARSNLWLNSADTSSPVPTVWVGDEAGTRVHPGTGLIAQGAHVLSPAGTSIFTAALTDNPAADATFYRRYHSNAAD